MIATIRDARKGMAAIPVDKSKVLEGAMDGGDVVTR